VTRKRSILGLIAILAVTFTASAIGGLVTAPATAAGGWYETLPLPSWTPPRWLFGPVWTTLYALMGLAAWLVWRERGSVRAASFPLGLYALQLVLNVTWSVVFFGLRSPTGALAEMGALWVAILATLVVFWRVRALAGALLVPYLAWVSFAAALNAAIVAGA